MKLTIAAALLMIGTLAHAAEAAVSDQLADDKRVRNVKIVKQTFNSDGSVTAVAQFTFYDGHQEQCTQEMAVHKPGADEVVRLTAKSRVCRLEKNSNWLWAM